MASFIKVWKLFGVIPLWKIERTFNENELRERMKILSKSNEFREQVKADVLDELNRAFAEPPAQESE